MNARRYPFPSCLNLARLAMSALCGLALASTQVGCCCFECIEHGTAPLHYIPHQSALTPRNPPCSYVDPMCYGYHATCWRSWSAECLGDRDCLEWCQQDALPIPAKGDTAPPMAPLAPTPEQPPAPAPAPPAREPQEEAELESSTDTQVRHAAGDEVLAPIVTPERVQILMRETATEDRPQRSSRRTVIERLPRVELP